MNIAAGVGIVAASINLWVSALHWAMSLAPGWKRTRLFGFIALTAGLYNALGVVFCTHQSEAAYLVAARLIYFVATLHCTAWLFYAYAAPDGSLDVLPVWVRRVAVGAAAVAVFFLVTGVGLRPATDVVAIPWAGFHYHYPQATLAGQIYGLAVPALLPIAFRKLWIRYRGGEKLLKWQLVAFGFFAICAVEEALVANRTLVFPSLADLAFLGLPIPLTIDSLRRIIMTARRVQRRAIRLRVEVERRTSERDDAQLALREAEREMGAIVASLDAVVWEADAITRRVRLVSDGAQRILGYSPAEWVATERFWFNRLHPEDRATAMAAEDTAAASGEPTVSEYRMFAADGRTLWFRDMVHPVLGPDGRPVALRGVMVDITAEHNATAALFDSQQRFRALFEAANDGVALLEDGIFVQVNRQMTVLFGCSEAQLVGRSALDYSPPLQNGIVSRERALSLRAAAAAGFPQRFRWTHQRADGTPFVADVSLSRVALTSGAYQLAIIRDVTAQLEMEEELRQSQKMDAIGRLAGGIAHDFNNLLTLINGYADLLLAEFPGNDSVAEVRAAGERATMLTQQLLAVSRKQYTEPRQVDLAGLVVSELDMLRRIIGEDIELDCRLEPGGSWVVADPGQLQQTVLNLVVNAREAMPRGGRMSIATTAASFSVADLEGRAERRAGSFVVLTVADTGRGMDENTRKRIFEPFFTTKPPGKGTGLGLAIVYGVVHQNGGWIEVESEPGAGTRFAIYLPRAVDVAPAAAADTPEQSLVRGTETILLVEDNDRVRAFARTVLASCGYQVVAVGHPREAFKLAEERERVFDLLLSDVVMPEMSGPDLAAAIARVRPELKVLFMSGYAAESGAVWKGPQESIQPLLQKPFSPQVLAERVREILDNPVTA